MAGLSVFRRTLYGLRWQILAYGLGLGLMAMLDTFIYPSYAGQLSTMELPESMKALLGGADYGTGRGFLGAEFFSWVPPLMVIFGVMAGTNALAGEEANGTLDLLLAQPVTRRQLVLSKMGAIAAGTCLITALIYAGWLLSVPFVEIDVGFGELFWATANIVPLIVFFAAFSMWLGAALGRAPATALAAALAVSGFFISYVGELVDAVRPVRVLSIFYYNGGAKAITEGVDPLRLLVLLALTAGVLFLAVRAFEQREIGVTNSPLRLPRLRLHRSEA